MKNLKDLYDSHYDGFKTIYEELEKEGLYDETSWPLLLSEWPGEKFPKAMFFGQETNGWVDGESIEELMEGYRRFNLGKNPEKPDNTLIWQYFRFLAVKMKLTGEHPFIWNNINKIGLASDKGRPNLIATELENKHFNVLAGELEIIRPEVCVFLTGPDYDNDIRRKLPDIEFIPIEGYSLRQFARLKSKYLPEKSFRTYHPGYGNRYPEWYEKILDKIAEA